MPLLKIEKLTEGLAGDWPGHLCDWDRILRAANHPETTRYNYLLAAAQLGRYLGEHSPDPDAEDAAEDPTDVTKAHVEHFQGWVIETRSAATALNKHKGLQQFFKYLVDEDEMDRSPMDRVKQPKTPKKLIPVMRDDDTKKLLEACKGKSFVNLRDEALIRLYYNTGARLSEVGNLLVTDLDLNTESVRFHGKGAKDRRVRFGPKTARTLSKYLRARAKRRDVEQVPNLWLAERGARPLLPNGIKIRLKRLGLAAGLDGVHAHRWRHNFAHEWHPRLAAGFEIGVATAWRYVQEVLALLNVAADDLDTAMRRIRLLACAILDGTLIPLDRVADQEPYYSGKRKRPA